MDYPVNLTIDYPDRLSRLTTAFRVILIAPIVIILALISGSGWGNTPWRAPLVVGGTVFLPTVLMLLFRQKYPRWWFDWNVNLAKFGLRFGAYAALLRDTYPSTDEEQAVHVQIDYPEVAQLKTGLPLVKWFLAIPHIFVLFWLAVAAVVVIVIAWFAILFTGRYPRPLFDYVVGVMRWGFRVSAYAFLLVTDVYPPFSLR